MKQQNYRCSITANISPAEAFKKISHVSGWWTENIEGSSEKLNDVFTVYFGETFVTFEIAEIVPDKKIVWYVMDCNLHWINDKKEWKNTAIVWSISTSGDAVTINMEHVGLVPEIECYENCEEGWDHYIQESLFKLITEHKGLAQKKLILTH